MSAKSNRSSARSPKISVSGYETSLPRTGLAVLLAVAGIAWLVVYTTLALDAALYDQALGGKAPSNPLPWMADLGRWNYLIGFGLIALGLIVASHRTTPLGRGRGVVVGMLGCFLIGLIWIVTYYFAAQETSFSIPVMDQLDQYNLLVGIGFMAVGFTYATKWE